MRNILALYGVRAVDQLLPIVVIPFLARVLGADGWGLVAGAQALAIYGIVTVEYGFEYRRHPRGRAASASEPGRLAELISGIFATQLLLACAIALVAVVVQLHGARVSRDQPALLWAASPSPCCRALPRSGSSSARSGIPLIAVIGVSRQGARRPSSSSARARAGRRLDGAGGLRRLRRPRPARGYALVLRQIRPGRLSLGSIGRTLKLGFSMFAMRVAVLMHTAGNSFLLLLLGAPVQVAFFAAGEKLCRPAAWLLQPINVALLPRLSHLVEHSPDQATAMAGLSIL